MSQAAPGALKRVLPSAPPEEAEPLDGLLAEIDAAIMPGITHWNHPSFFAYFPSNSDLSSVLADLLAAGLGTQGMSWQTSPAATELEEVVLEWLRQLLDLPPTFHGVIQDTASSATLVALLCARERSTGFSQTRGGLQDEAAPLVVYLSDQAHSSVDKAALLAGFGRQHLRVIESDEAHALRPALLADAIRRDLADGKRPCAIVATCGTTATTALDPVGAVAEIAAQHQLWLHLDAAMAGTAMILPECRWMWEGVARADSLVLNPHKWMGVGFDLSVYYTRDPEHLVRVMSTNPSYLRTAQDGSVTNFRDWGIPLGRRFRALKLWLLLKSEGAEGIRARLRGHLALARSLCARIDAAPGWERLAPAPLQTLCVRHVPAGLAGDEDALRRHNVALVDEINQSGRAYLTPTILKGKQAIRISIGANATEARHVDALWTMLQEAAQR